MNKMNTSTKKVQPIHLKWQFFIVLFVVAVISNYVWELLQSPFYTGMQINSQMFGHCFFASLGDGVIVLVIYFFDWLIFRRWELIGQTVRLRLAVMVSTGFIVGAIIEWIGVFGLQRWSYNDLMPIFPGLRIGLIPTMQMVILPPIIFLIVEKWWLGLISGRTSLRSPTGKKIPK